MRPMPRRGLTSTVLQEHSMTRPRLESSNLPSGRYVVEVLGPAGAGKTTFVRSLNESYTPVQDHLTTLWPDKVWALGSVLRDLLPRYICTYSTSRWFNVDELRRMS